MIIQNINNLFKKLFVPSSNLIVFILLFILIFTIYTSAIFFDYNYLDDQVLILQNKVAFSSLNKIPALFTSGVFMSSGEWYYRPMQNVFYLLCFQIGKTNPMVYHMANILIHLFATYLFFLLLTALKYTRKPALFASLIFACHPILVQAISWIPGSGDSLLAISFLASFLFLISYLQKQNSTSIFWHLLFFTLALFTKETAIVLIPIFLLYIFSRSENKGFNKSPLLISFWLIITAAWAFARSAVLKGFSALTFPAIAEEISKNFLPITLQSISKLFWPFFTPLITTTDNISFTYLLLGALILITLFSFALKIKIGLKKYFGFLWFMIFIIPSFLISFHLILDNRLYIPLMGILIFLLDLEIFKDRKYFKIIFIIIIICFSIASFSTSQKYKDRLTFWENATKTAPKSSFIHKNLGAMYHLENKFDLAEKKYLTSLKLNKFEPMVNNNLGLIYMSKNKFTKAEKHFQKETAINPSYANAYFNYGLLKYRQRRILAAEKLWKTTIQLEPRYFDAYYNLAALAIQKGRKSEANKYLQALENFGIDTNGIITSHVKSK